MAGHARWRAVAETWDLANIVGPRVRFLCLDVDHTHVVLGANTGSAYVFARGRAVDDTSAATSANDSGESRNREGSLKFLTMVSPTDAPAVEPRDDVGPTSGGGPEQTPAPPVPRRNITPALTKIKLHPNATLCAVANAAGVVQVLEFLPQFDGSRSSPGRVVVQIPHAHAGREVTVLEWSGCGQELISGDDAGTVAVTDISASDSENEKYFLARRPMTPDELVTVPVVTQILECGSPVVQASWSPNGDMAVVSTQNACFVLSIATGVRPRLGSKPREGWYGACFHSHARAAVDMDFDWNTGGVSNHVNALQDKHSGWIIASRPGRRLWIAQVWVDDDGATPVSRVAVTLKPTVPPPSHAPGSVHTQSPRKKKFEFGEIYPLGAVCALATSDKALAVIELPGGSLLRWFPVNEPNASGVAAGVCAVATFGAKAFVLADHSETGGPGGGVWCLEVPANPYELVCLVADQAARSDGNTESVTRALLLATQTRVVEMRLLEDARGARATAAAREREEEVPDEQKHKEIGELETALEAYEAFVLTVDTPPPPPRPCPTETVYTPVLAPPLLTMPIVPKPPDVRVPVPTAPVTTALPKVPSFSRGGRTSPAPDAAAVDEYPPADASTKFFFYNPRGGFVKGDASSGDVSDAVVDDTGTSGAVAAKPPTVGNRNLEKKIMRATVIDTIAAAPNTAPAVTKTFGGDKAFVDPDLDPETAAETAAATARLEEDLADATNALKNLVASEADELSDHHSSKFAHWREYAPWDVDDECDADKESGSLEKLPARALGFSAADRRRDKFRRARQEHVDAAANARETLALARRSLDAGGLVPLLRRWRLSRGDVACWSVDARNAGANGVSSPALDDSLDGCDDTVSDVPASLVYAAEQASAAVDVALARVEARLELACAELSLFAKDGDESAAPAEFGVFAAAAVAERDKLFAEKTTRVLSSVASTEHTGDVPEIVDSGSTCVETRAEELVTGGGARDALETEKNGVAASRRRRATLAVLPAETAQLATTEAMRRLLRDIVSAAEEETLAMKFALATPSKTKDALALVRRARGKGAASLSKLESLADAAAATAAVGAELALSCFERAITVDDVLAGFTSASSMTSLAGQAVARAVTSVSLDLGSFAVERLARERAAAQTLAPLERHLASPPPAAVGRFPQLRAVLCAESTFVKDPADTAPLRALPFVKQEKAGTGEKFSLHGIPRATPIAPFLEERGDWGAKVPFSKGRCPRCFLFLSDSRDSLPGLSAKSENAYGQLVTFPCGHTFHTKCVPEDACVECLRISFGRLGEINTREGAAVKAELAHMLGSFVT